MGDNSFCAPAANPAPGATTVFSHDPYSWNGRKVLVFRDVAADSKPAAMTGEQELPPMRHPALWGYIAFVGFAPPAEEPACTVDPPKEMLKRVFIGQLPLRFTDMQLEHAIAVATGGLRVMHIERIVKWTQNREPTGCAHAYCRGEDQAAIIGASKRVLFDNFGVWCAQPGGEAAMLAAHMRQVPAPPRPYTTGLVTVEKAKSSYQPDERYRIAAFDPRW